MHDTNKSHYFVTQARTRSEEFKHITVSTASHPKLLVKQIALYAGQDETTAEDIAKNLRTGTLIVYSPNLLRGIITATRSRCENGTIKIAFGTGGVPSQFDLSWANPFQDLEDMVGGRYTRMDFFAQFSQAEIKYLSSLDPLLAAAVDTKR